MKLRKLKLEDAPLMLEWMHDDSVVHDLRTDFVAKTIDDCNAFIETARDDSESIHLAIVDENDEYMGTVSLKHIRSNSAEFGITIRKCAMGKGFSRFAMESIIQLGFKERGIKTIFWCVNPENKRAVRFYDKNGYQRCDAPDYSIGYTEEERNKFFWYSVENK